MISRPTDDLVGDFGITYLDLVFEDSGTRKT